MMLWFAIILLITATVLALGWPLLRIQAQGPVDAGLDAHRTAVYADQLAEIETERARGSIDATEAEAARLEVSRRLLAQAGDEVPAASPVKASPILLVAVALVPVLALGVYAMLGSPSLPGAPMTPGAIQAARPGGGAPDIDQLIAQVETRLRSAPDDGRGWDAIAPVYLKVGRYEEARAAFARAIGLQGESTKRLIGLAESGIRAKDGIVTDEARDAFAKVLIAEPDRLEARFWLALGREQHGELVAAADEYRAILAATPPQAGWRQAVVERLAAVSGGAGVAAPDKGPSVDDVAAAQNMPPEARLQMISGMVDGLHARLRADGRDVAGWQKLLRAYAVLADKPKAVAALAEARRAMADDSQALAALDALAREMGF